MKIKYEMEDCWLITPCPHGVNITRQDVCMVGSLACAKGCPYFIDGNKKGQTIECGHPVKFFVEIEEFTPLHGVIKYIKTFKTQENRNFFMDVVDIWKGVKITRFGQGDWNA